MATRKKKSTSSKKKAAKATGKRSTKKASEKKKPATKKTAAKKKPATKKTAAKKKPATKKTAAKKKPATKKTAAKKKPATKKTAAKKKPATKKTAAKKKPATKKTAAKKKPATKKTAAKKKPATKQRIAVAVRKARSKKPKASASDPPAAPSSGKRNFGLRGAAPWVARHAAKHADELRKRNAEPPPPGSARATLRVPEEAESIKSNVGHLHQLTSKIRSLRKKLEKNFFEIGEILAEVQEGEFFEAKGYSTFEAFLDRELDLPRTMSLRLLRISHTFQRETAYDFGLERLTAALAALDGDTATSPSSHPSSRGWSSASLPPKPPIRYDD